MEYKCLFCRTIGNGSSYRLPKNWKRIRCLDKLTGTICNKCSNENYGLVEYITLTDKILCFSDKINNFLDSLNRTEIK